MGNNFNDYKFRIKEMGFHGDEKMKIKMMKMIERENRLRSIDPGFITNFHYPVFKVLTRIIRREKEREL